MKDLVLCIHVVVNLKFGNFILSFGRLRQRIQLKCVPHMQHDYSSSFNQSYHCFLASSLRLPSSLIKLPIAKTRPVLFRCSDKNRSNHVKKKSKELLSKINSLIQDPPLDFLVHCDGAWGGYFCTMMREPPAQIQRQATANEGFVPELPLSFFVQKQLNRMKDVDTVTLDPHKSGFCTYPAGAIAYRKARINDVVSSMVEADTPYYYGSVNLGNWGIEGSKPGNSAAAVYLANKVRQK